MDNAPPRRPYQRRGPLATVGAFRPPSGRSVMSERFSTHMSDADALMWNIEKDPVLRSTIVAVGILDRAPDWDRLRARFERASVTVPRLRQRVLSPALRLGPPRWAHEENFDLDFHMRRYQ